MSATSSKYNRSKYEVFEEDKSETDRSKRIDYTTTTNLADRQQFQFSGFGSDGVAGTHDILSEEKQDGERK